MKISNLTGLAVFAKVVEFESFSRAADDLGVSKSAISKQIAALEDHLGARLLNRTTRRLSVTNAGARLYERCRTIVAEVEAAELEAGQLHSQPTGVLRISVGMSFGHLHLAPALSTFLGIYPEINVELVMNDRIVDLVDEGYDLALRIAELETSSMMQRRLTDIRLLTAAAPSYLKRHGEPLHPSDLTGHSCIGYSYVWAGGAWRFNVPDRSSRVRISPRVQINNGDAIAKMAEDGIGITQLPSFIMAEALRAGRLVPILDAFEPPPLGLYAVYPHSRNLSVKVRVFIDFLVQHFAGTPYWDTPITRR
ncbi:MAG: LysR family transcriptional regulator [Proteobacteria bacterium]|nr:LysR family transcriptional regulator [Pseudomonadota bacterium]